MSMTSTVANKLNNAIASAFGKIGDTNGTKMPQPADNNAEPHVWEYYIATTLERIAKKRKENAEKELQRVGVLFDATTAPRPSGTRESLFVGNNVMVNLAVNNAPGRLNEKLFIIELNKLGVSLQLIEKARIEATKPTRAPHLFSAILNTRGD